MKQSIYTDTSGVGGYYDEEFREDIILFFERLDRGEVLFVISDLLDVELLNTPLHVKNHLEKLGQ